MARLASIIVVPKVMKYDLGTTTKNVDDHDESIKRKRALGNANISLNVGAKTSSTLWCPSLREASTSCHGYQIPQYDSTPGGFVVYTEEGEPIFEDTYPSPI